MAKSKSEDVVTDDTDLYTSVDNVTNTIFKAAEIAISNKTVCIRKHDPPWINGLDCECRLSWLSPKVRMLFRNKM
jgi:hypothetical protein